MTELAIKNKIIQETIREAAEEEDIFKSSIIVVADYLIFDSIETCLSDIIKEAMDLEMIRLSEGNCNCVSEIKALKEELKTCRSTIDHLSMKLKEQSPPFCKESLRDDISALIHTGLPNLKILKVIFDHVLQMLLNDKLTLFQEFMCTMLKLRLNTPLQGWHINMVYLRQINVSRIILKWLIQMDTRLQDLIIWPDWESLKKTMPMCFQESFGKDGS